MRVAVWSGFLMATVWAAGCVLTASIGRDYVEAESEGPASETGAPSSPTPEATSGATGTETGGGGGHGWGGTTTSAGDSAAEEHTPDEGSGTADHPSTCSVAVSDSTCLTCRKTECCDELQLCHDGAECYALWQCIDNEEHTEAVCREMFGDHDALDAVLSCTDTYCADVCDDPLADTPFG